jgi:hypothetical protein
MDGELERYNRNNAAQDLSISDLRLRHSGAQAALARERASVQASQLVIRCCRSAPAPAHARAALCMPTLRGSSTSGACRSAPQRGACRGGAGAREWQQRICCHGLQLEHAACADHMRHG